MNAAENRISVSLIVPLYNGSEYIENFLQMTENQSLQELEVILVDDCSTDGWVEKAEKYLAGREFGEKVRFLSTEVNSGPGAARNVGLQVALGEYVCFVDCDDEFEKDYCELLYLEAKRCDADMVCCDAECDGRLLKAPDFKAGELSVETRARILATFVTRLWTYTFRRQFLIDNKIAFPATRSAEDTAFVTLGWFQAKRASHLPKALYRYILRSNSLSSKRMQERSKQRKESMNIIKTHAKAEDLRIGIALKWLLFKKGTLMAIKDRLQ